MRMPMIALTFMIVVSDQPLSVAYIDQRIFEPVRRCRGPWDIIDFHFYEPSLLIHLSRVEDQFTFRHMAVNTICKWSVKEHRWKLLALQGRALIGTGETRYCAMMELQEWLVHWQGEAMVVFAE
jgi:hypothetical protein